MMKRREAFPRKTSLLIVRVIFYTLLTLFMGQVDLERVVWAQSEDALSIVPEDISLQLLPGDCQTETIIVTLGDAQPTNLDIALVFDATGSMLLAAELNGGERPS